MEQKETEKTVLERRDEAADILYRVRAMLASTIYLMGGEVHMLKDEYADIETWLADMRDRLDEAIGVVVGLRGDA